MGFCSCTEPAAAATRGTRDEEAQARRPGRKGEILEAELYRLLGSEHRHKFVLKVENPEGWREGAGVLLCKSLAR